LQYKREFYCFDGKLVITGSYNWTASAEHRNYENMIVIYDKEVIRAFEFEKEFFELWRGE